MTRHLFYLVPLLLSALVPAPASSQLGALQLEVDGGAVFPTDDYDQGGIEDEVDGGPGFGVHFGLRQGHLTWIVGFSQNRVECGPSLCEGDLVSTGWDLGLRLRLLDGPVLPWVGGGVTARIVEADVFDPTLDRAPEQDAPVFEVESDRSWGVEAAAGVIVRLAERVGLNPKIRYSRLSPDLPLPAIREMEVRQWVVDLGLVLAF